jgi:Ca-activated chloride channel family protein
MTGDFHFIRPLWLLALIPLAFLVLGIRRRQDGSRAWHGIVAPHLLPFLLSGEDRSARISLLLFIGVGWLMTVIAVAGPAWRREPAPFADDTAALAIVVAVSPSMMTEDVQPGRLARAVEKIHDLLSLRRGAKSALIAYAGSAHRVMPPTSDESIINTFAQALDPKIMPVQGDAAAGALRLADAALQEAGGGSILWITDAIAPEQLSALQNWRRQSRTQVQLLAPLLEGGELETLSRNARSADAEIIRLTPGDADVKKLARAAKFVSSSGGARGDQWEESGYWLTPLLAGLLLPFFRKGWMTSTAAGT